MLIGARVARPDSGVAGKLREAPPAGFEPARMPPEGTALSPELRGLGTDAQATSRPRALRQTADTTGCPHRRPLRRPAAPAADGQYGGSQPDHRQRPPMTCGTWASTSPCAMTAPRLVELITDPTDSHDISDPAEAAAADADNKRRQRTPPSRWTTPSRWTRSTATSPSNRGTAATPRNAEDSSEDGHQVTCSDSRRRCRTADAALITAD
jgi:hypothetical protein